MINNGSGTISNGIRKFNPILILGILLLFVNNLPGLGEALGKQVATISLMGAGIFLLILYRPRNISLNNIPFLFIFMYSFYVILNNLIHIYISNERLIFNDLAEPLRILAIIIFYVVGASSYSKIRSRDIKLLFLLFLTLSIILIAGWFGGGVFRIGIYDFYITRGGRFSGLVASVNYVWVTSIIIVGLGILYFNKVSSNLPHWGVLTLLLLVSLLSLALSGGRASLLGFLVGTLLIIIFSGKKSRKVAYVLGGGIVMGVMLLLNFTSGNFISQLGRTIDRIQELFIAIQYVDLAQVAAYDARLSMWTRAWSQIQENILFGHGSSKSGIAVIDNTYLMTLYRYGVVGLFLEIMLYLSFIWICIKKVKSNVVYTLPLAFLVAYLITGITSAPFYELKTPYILAFLIGWFTAVEPKFEATKQKVVINKTE